MGRPCQVKLYEYFFTADSHKNSAAISFKFLFIGIQEILSVTSFLKSVMIDFYIVKHII